MNGHPAGMTMEVFNSGTTELTALIMFVVDATKPFSVPAKFECPLLALSGHLSCTAYVRFWG